MKKWAVLACLLSCPAYAAGAPEKAIDLERLCKSVDNERGTPMETLEGMYCVGYIAGILDTEPMMDPQFSACLPSGGVPNDEGRRVFLKHLAENPKSLSLQPRLAVLLAFKLAYPCKPAG